MSWRRETYESSPRRRGGGFTFEVQHLGESLGRGFEVKAFSRSVVVGGDEGVESAERKGCEVGLARNEAAHSPDGVFDAALLPGSVGVAEEGFDGEAMKCAMTRELGAVVEGDGLAQLWWHAGEESDEMTRHSIGGFVGRPGREDDAGLALMDGQHRLAVFGEQHEVGFPMTGGFAVGGGGRPFGHGNTAFNEACGASALPAPAASLALAAREIAAPAVILGAGDLGVDEAVDALVADHLAAGLAGEPAGDLLGRPAAGETLSHGAAQPGLAFEARARPAPRRRLFLGITWFVADLPAAIATYLTRDRRWRAIQSCRDLPDRSPIGLKAGNLASVFQ